MFIVSGMRILAISSVFGDISTFFFQFCLVLRRHVAFKDCQMLKFFRRYNYLYAINAYMLYCMLAAFFILGQNGELFIHKVHKARPIP